MATKLGQAGELLPCFKKNSEAYTDTIISGTVYGHDGKLMNDQGDGSTYQIVTLDYDLVKKGAKDGEIEVKAGTRVLMNEYGKIKKSGSVTDVNGMKVTVSDYAVVREEEKD